jgi:shikimate kinase
MKSETIVLVGFMGSGKSSVARVLARRLELPLLDLDSCIEASAHKSVAQIFADEGEDRFRALESEALRHSLLQPGVLATGGGVPTREENRAALQNAQAQVVYLRAQPETLATRIRRQTGTRPLIDGDRVLDWNETRARVAELLAQRADHYERCADIVIDVDHSSVGQIAEEIAKHLEI